MKLTIAVLSLNILLSSFILAVPIEHTFTALVSDVRLAAQLTEEGKGLDDTVTVHAEAVIFEEPLVITDVRLATRHSNPEVNAIINYHKTLCSEPLASDLLQFWIPDEREGKEVMMDNESLQFVHDYFAKNPSLRILGIIYQADTSSVLVEMSSFTKGCSLRENDGELLLTDHPSNDLELAIIEASFQKKN